MLVWRTVATPRRAALLARAQMKPLISRLYALLANSLFWLFNIGNPIDVNAYLCCHAASILTTSINTDSYAATKTRDKIWA